MAPAPRGQSPITRENNRGLRTQARSACQSNLFHERLVVPEQPIVIHRSSFPVAERCHVELERSSCRLYYLAVPRRHGPGERAGH